MIECTGCHRFVHATESSCPFCAVPLKSTSAASVAKLQLAFAAGLLFACTDSDDEAGESNAVTTDPGSTDTTSTSTTGDGDGDTSQTTDYTDYSGADYGGPALCDELASAIPLNVGGNPVDTSMSADSHITSCAGQSGGPDMLLQFDPPATGHFTFAIVGANFDAWLLEFLTYECYAFPDPNCVLNQSLEIDLYQGETLYLVFDGVAGGTANIDVTQG